MAYAKSALDGVRLRALRELKGIRTQQALAELVGVSQSHICDLEKGKLRNPDVFLRVSDELDCTTDFLFRRGPFKDADSPQHLRDAASRMALDVYSILRESSEEKQRRCRRVLGHKAAPLTASGWADLAEQIDLAVGPDNGGARLRAVD